MFHMKLITNLLISNLLSITNGAIWPLSGEVHPIETFYINPQNLWTNRQYYKEGNRALNPAINRVIREADAAILDNRVYSVTAKQNLKIELPPSNDPKDFYSLARYYWPDKNSTTGLPYTRIDGQTNPEINTLPDSTYAKVVFQDVNNCALAYFFTNDEKYALRATIRIREWFTSPTTGMNPNLNYANWVKGTPAVNNVNTTATAKAGGLLDFSRIYLIMDAIGIIKNSASFTEQDYNDMQSWFTKYLDWLQNSVRGALESTATNNQGTWYDVQKVAILLFLRNFTEATNVQSLVTQNRIPVQIMSDGSQPLEQARPLSWYYSNFNLEGYFVHQSLSKSTGVDLFKFHTQDGRSVVKALDYLSSFALVNGTNWPVPNIGGFDLSNINQMEKDAFVILRDTKYIFVSDTIQKNKPITWNLNRLWAPFGAYDAADTSDALALETNFWLLILGLYLMYY